MSRLTREQRSRQIKGFLMTSGGIALAMVLFSLLGQRELAGNLIFALGAILTLVVAPVLLLCKKPMLTVYGVMSTGLGIAVGALVGSWVMSLLL